MDQQQVPPEVLQAMLELSTQDEDNAALKQQMELSKMLQQGGLKYQSGLGGGSNVGGFAGALAQGMQGYMGGKQMVENKDALGKLKTQRQGNRQRFFEYATMGGPQGKNPLEDYMQSD